MQILFGMTIIAAMISWAGSYAPAVAYVMASIVAFADERISTVLDLAALAAIFGSFLAYNRIKTALTASESAGKAWHEEAEAAMAKSTRAVEELKDVEKERLALVAKVTALEQRPDLGNLEHAVSALAEAAATQIAALTEVTLTHEKNAETRSHRVVDAIKEISSGGNGSNPPAKA